DSLPLSPLPLSPSPLSLLSLSPLSLSPLPLLPLPLSLSPLLLPLSLSPLPLPLSPLPLPLSLSPLPLSLSPLPLLPPSSRGEERPGGRVVVVGLPSSPMCTTGVGSLFGTVLDVSVVSREVDSATASPSMVRVVSSSPVPVVLPPRGVPAPPECAASSLFGPSSDGPASWA